MLPFLAVLGGHRVAAVVEDAADQKSRRGGTPQRRAASTSSCPGLTSPSRRSPSRGLKPPLTIFERGAILLHLGERSDALLPADPRGRCHPRVTGAAHV